MTEFTRTGAAAYLRRCYRKLRVRKLRKQTRARLVRMKREWQRREMAGRV